MMASCHNTTYMLQISHIANLGHTSRSHVANLCYLITYIREVMAPISEK